MRTTKSLYLIIMINDSFMTSNNPFSFLEEVENIVINTADKLLNHYFLQTSVTIKADGSIVTEADTAMQDALTLKLSKLAPDIQMLSEEMTSEKQLGIIQGKSSYWCLDPVDGTNNYHHGLPLFAVSLALIENNNIILGIIYDPIRKELFSAASNTGLRINQSPHTHRDQPLSLKECLASIDFKRLNSELKQRLVSQSPFKSQRNIGTCALEWAWLAAGRTQLLLHGGEKFWDYAAGSFLLQKAGGKCCTHLQHPIFNNTLEDRSIIAASNSELHKLWLDFLVA